MVWGCAINTIFISATTHLTWIAIASNWTIFWHAIPTKIISTIAIALVLFRKFFKFLFKFLTSYLLGLCSSKRKVICNTNANAIFWSNELSWVNTMVMKIGQREVSLIAIVIVTADIKWWRVLFFIEVKKFSQKKEL